MTPQTLCVAYNGKTSFSHFDKFLCECVKDDKIQMRVDRQIFTLYYLVNYSFNFYLF